MICYALRDDRKVSEETRYYINSDYFNDVDNCYYDSEEELVEKNYEKLGMKKVG